MQILFIIAPLFAVIALVRFIAWPLRRGQRYRTYYGYGYDRGYNPYRHGRRGWRLGGLGTMVALVALDRLFGGRRF